MLCDPQKLDLVVYYLGMVHLYDYYNGLQSVSPGSFLDSWRGYMRALPSVTDVVATSGDKGSAMDESAADAAGDEDDGDEKAHAGAGAGAKATSGTDADTASLSNRGLCPFTLPGPSDFFGLSLLLLLLLLSLLSSSIVYRVHTCNMHQIPTATTLTVTMSTAHPQVWLCGYRHSRSHACCCFPRVHLLVSVFADVKSTPVLCGCAQ